MKSLLPLRIDGVWLSIDAADVVEILGPRAWTALPGASPIAPGVIAFRGRAIAAIDLGALRGGAAALGPGEPRARTVVAQHGASTFALPADAVREVLSLAEIGDPPSDVASPPAPFLAGDRLEVLDLGQMIEAASLRA